MRKASALAGFGACAATLLAPGGAAAEPQIGTWSVDPSLGQSDYGLRVRIFCSGALFCLFINGYDWTRAQEITGGGGVSLTEGGAFLVHARFSGPGGS